MATRVGTKKNLQHSCCLNLSQKSGFTLIELLVVVALIGIMSAFALPSVSNYFNLSLSSFTREFAAQIKESQNSAALTGNIYRMVYDLEAKQYWVESAPPGTLLDAPQEKDSRFQEEEEESQKDTKFTLEESITKKAIDLPSGVEFDGILNNTNQKPIQKGLVYTHIFPNGFSEWTVVRFKDSSDHKISLIISAVAAKTLLHKGSISKEDALALELE